MEDDMFISVMTMKLNLTVESPAGVTVGKRSAEVRGDTRPSAVNHAKVEVPH